MKLEQRTWRLSLLLSAIFIPIFILADAGSMDISAENGPLENVQVGLLFIAGVCFILPVFQASRGGLCFLLAGGLLCLSFILREVDVEDLAVPYWVIFCGSGTGRNILMALGWLALGILTIKSRRAVKELIKPIIQSRVTIFLVISGLLLLLSDLFENVGVAQIYEEIAEAIAYIVLLMAAIALRSRAVNKESF